MIVWTWPRLKPDPTQGLGFRRTAPHLRARVYRTGERTRLGDWMWAYEVVNQNTGEVVASDNCADFASMAYGAHQSTAAARAAWFYGFRQKDVR